PRPVARVASALAAWLLPVPGGPMKSTSSRWSVRLLFAEHLEHLALLTAVDAQRRPALLPVCEPRVLRFERIEPASLERGAPACARLRSRRFPCGWDPPRRSSAARSWRAACAGRRGFTWSATYYILCLRGS